jgi:hypothetical protein
MTSQVSLSTCGRNVLRVGALAVAAALAVSATSRSADAAILLDYNNNAVVIADGGAGDLDGVANGQIINQQVIAGFGVTINVATSNSPGLPSGGSLQISSLSVENLNPGPGPAQLTIRVSDIGFTAPGGAGSQMTLSSALGGTFLHATINDSVTFQSFADPANAQPAVAVTSGPQVHLKSTAADPESFNSSVATNFLRGAGPYSLTNITTLSLSPGATFEQVNDSGTTLATLVPEPASLGIMGIGALALLARRRRTA